MSRVRWTTDAPRHGMNTQAFIRPGALLLVFLGLVTLGGCEDLTASDTSSLFFPGFQRSEIVGMVAGLGTTFAAVPDLIAMLRHRSSAGHHQTMAAILGVFQIIWVYYGLLIGSRPVIAWNLIAVLINFSSVGAHTYFAHKQRRERERLS